MNPTSGKGKFALHSAEVARRLMSGGYDVTVLQGVDAADAADLARGAVAEGCDVLVAMGGDGMVHLALQVVAGTATRLGIIPTGTGNDVARYLDLPRADPLAAADVVVAGKTRTIDLASTGTAVYATVLASGFDSLVNERANSMHWPKGQMRYNLATLAELRVFKPLPYTPRTRRDADSSWRRCWSPSATARPTAAGCGCARGPCSTMACWTW